MRETRTYGSMRGSRRKTAKSVLRGVEDRAGVPDKGRSALLYTLFDMKGRRSSGSRTSRSFAFRATSGCAEPKFSGYNRLNVY